MRRLVAIVLPLSFLLGCGTSGGGASSGDAGAEKPSCAAAGTTSTCEACTFQGNVAGSVEGATCAYRGIPYAKPPTGNLRFMPPQPADAWKGVLQAKAFGTACLQGAGNVNLAGSSNAGEDCLFLNVWTPEKPPAAPLPVMVFVYGGGYTSGATNTYDGVGLATKGPVVVVSMNYRTGALGFFAHPDLDTQRSGAPSGSDGIRDQQLALKWVHDNIASFHGDPQNVTVFGESAGASSVGVHVASPLTHGLAHRFVLESGVATRSVSGGIEAQPQAVAYAYGRQMASDLCPGASDPVQCLRGLPANTLMQWTPSPDAGSSSGQWGPVVEGPGGVLPNTPDALMQGGKFNPGEIIVGTNKNEYALFALLQGSASSYAQLQSLVQTQFPDSASAIMALYAPDPSVDANQAYVDLKTDIMFRCASRSFARLAASKGRSVYLYSFEQGAARHSDELVFVFGRGNFTLALDAPVQPLSDDMQGYWTTFARTGDPNGGGRPAWPKYDAAMNRNMTLAATPSVATGLRKAACDFWDTYLSTH
jgi:para-nitrobenzyl esterase